MFAAKLRHRIEQRREDILDEIEDYNSTGVLISPGAGNIGSGAKFFSLIPFLLTLDSCLLSLVLNSSDWYISIPFVGFAFVPVLSS